jgi:RimJ/RimL family protein N-acetyltransferase
MSVVPPVVHTERLLIRSYRESDADQLRPILASSGDYLSAWLPKHVWEPVPVEELSGRLARYAELFDDDIEWRYAVLDSSGRELIGSVGLFPRDEARRVPYEEADRVEIGYWIRKDHSGQGLATEASRAMLEVARSLAGIERVEIRCDARNGASAAVPKKLGFSLSKAPRQTKDELQVWGMEL